MGFIKDTNRTNKAAEKENKETERKEAEKQRSRKK